jgi:hypothetical protein
MQNDKIPKIPKATLQIYISSCTEASLGTLLHFLSAAQEPKSGLGRLFFEVYRPQTITQTHTHTRQDSSERVVSPSQRPLSTRQTTNNRRISTLSAGFKHAIPGIKQLQTNALDRTATGTVSLLYTQV